MQDSISTDTDDPTDRPGFHARRGALYGYVATALKFPDAAVLGDLRDDDVQDAIVSAASALAGASAEGSPEASTDADGDTLVERVHDLSAAIDAASDDEIEAAYNAVFGLPGEDGSYPVVPYEAHYSTSGDVNDTQRRVATVVGLLERFDLEPHDEFDERQDHVAVLLELAQVMATQRAVALENGDADAAAELAAAEATVLDEHLLGFVPALAHDVREVHGAGGGGGGSGESGGAVPGADAVDDPGLAVYVAAADLAAELVRWDDRVHPEESMADAGETRDHGGGGR